MLNRSASLAMSTTVLKALPGKLHIKRHSPSILYSYSNECFHLVENNKSEMVHCIYAIWASMQENLSWWFANNKGVDQPV